MRIVIACAGHQRKWGGHLGVPSHLVPVGGRPLLHRTVGQALAVTSDVHITSPDDDRYRIPGAVRHVRAEAEPSEYASTRALWSEDGRTVLLLGDVYFTAAAFATIAKRAERAYRVFGRYGPSKVTGTPYGEIFAASWWPEHHGLLDRHLDVVHRTRAAGTVTRPPGWMLLRAWQGTPLGRHRVIRPPFVDVDDLTDDLDTPDDYRRHPAFGGTRG